MATGKEKLLVGAGGMGLLLLALRLLQLLWGGLAMVGRKPAPGGAEARTGRPKPGP